MPPLLFLFALLTPYILLISTSSPPGPVTQTINMPLDHFNHRDTWTFPNTYLNTTFHSPGGLITLCDSSEARAFNVAAEFFNTYVGTQGETLSAPIELARCYHGIVIVWEHRYYGFSMPFPYNSTTGLADAGAEAYEYLNNE
jgi:hypothetical protein